jgi:predicted DNA-binding transcriptional regulator AlpA
VRLERDLTRAAYLTRPEVAELLSVHVSTVDRWLALGRRTKGQRGLHPSVVLGDKVVRVPRRAVDAFVARATV